MARKFANISEIAGNRIIPINKADIRYEKPVVSITYLCTNKYCLKHLAEVHTIVKLEQEYQDGRKRGVAKEENKTDIA